MLEEGSFRGRSSDFVMMFLFGGVLMTILAFFVNLLFLGQAFTIMLVYVWSRRNPFVRMNFFGLLNFQVSEGCGYVRSEDTLIVRFCTGTVSSVGSFVLLNDSWKYDMDRFDGHGRWPYLLFSRGCIPTPKKRM